MVIIYTDKNKVETGELINFKMEHEESTLSDNCTFEIQAPETLEIDIGGYVYSEGTYYGGRVQRVNLDTSTKKTIYTGDTWRGLLSKKIICPDPGDNYLILSGDLNTIISTLISRCDYTSLFSVSAGVTTSLTNYQFDRYTTLLDGIMKMLKENGYKLSMSVSAGVCNLAAVPITDYSNNYEITEDRFSFKVQREGYLFNHVIALGSGELSARTVVDKYIQQDGTIGDTQYYTGADEIVYLLDYPNAESTTELEAAAVEKLKEAKVQDGIKVTAYSIDADIGDLLDGTVSNVTFAQYITNKITTITDEYVKNQYKVGGI